METMKGKILTTVRYCSIRPSTLDSWNWSLYCGKPISSSQPTETRRNRCARAYKNGRLRMQVKSNGRSSCRSIWLPRKELTPLCAFPKDGQLWRHTFPAEAVFPRELSGTCMHAHCPSLRVTQMWSSRADFSSCLVLMAFTAKISFFLCRGCLIPNS